MGECGPAGFGNLVPLRAIIPGLHSSLLRELPSRDDNCCSLREFLLFSAPLGSLPAEMPITSLLWPIVVSLLHSTKISVCPDSGEMFSNLLHSRNGVSQQVCHFLLFPLPLGVSHQKRPLLLSSAPPGRFPERIPP